MDLGQLVEQEFTQPLREAILTDDLVATRQLINSVSQTYIEANNQQIVKVFAESYILELRDGEQYKNELSLSDIATWIDAKGLSGTLDPSAVYNSILRDGTIWDRQGGVKGLQKIINDQNVKRVLDIAIANEKTKLLGIKWL